MLGTLLATIFAGFPIAFTLIILSIIFGFPVMGEGLFSLLVSNTLGVITEETFAAVPLFIFMGYILERVGLMDRLFRSFQQIVAPVPGALYLSVIVLCTLFAAATGIIGASVTLMSLIAAPIMIRSGYDVRMSAGAIAAGGTLGILIPPSVMLVVMGPVMGVSVAKLFAGAVIPGLILSGLYISYTLIRSLINQRLGPPIPAQERIVSRIEVLKDFVAGALPLAALIFATLGSILIGLATPTEAAGMGAVMALVLAIAYRRLSFRLLKEMVYNTIQTSSMVLILVMASVFFGAVFTHLGTTTFIAQTLLKIPLPPIGFIIMLMSVIFLLGWPLEWAPVVLIFCPIFLPIVKGLGFDVLWFSILVAVNLQTAFLSPPVAMAAYYVRGTVPSWELKDIYMGMLQFMMLQLVGLLLLLFFPSLALWLPTVLYGR
jgi:tripartite ATP-independent transporter DctM subunit